MNTSDLFVPGRKKARIEIIPLIDVIFFLLATFVLFTLSLDKLGGLSVPLPRVPPPGSPPPTETLFIQATDAGMVYWKQGNDAVPEQISLAELPPRLSQYKHNVANPRVMVRGDGKAKLGPAVTVLDLVREAGITQVSIETLVSKTGS
jgi:biopolymer transport protein ExbD